MAAKSDPLLAAPRPSLLCRPQIVTENKIITELSETVHAQQCEINNLRQELRDSNEAVRHYYLQCAEISAAYRELHMWHERLKAAYIKKKN